MIRSGVLMVCLLAVALPLLRVAEAGDASAEKDNQHKTAKNMLKKLPGSPPPGVLYHCSLFKHLRHYAECNCTSVPTGGYGIYGQDKADLLAFIAQLESELEASTSACSCDPDDDKVVEVAIKLQVFLEVHVSIYNALSYMTLNDSVDAYWGTPKDFCRVKDVIQSEKIDPVVELDLDEDCPLFQAMNETAEESGDQEIIDDCARVIVLIRKQLKITGFNVTQKLGMIYQLIQRECRAKTIKRLKDHCSISGFGLFIGFIDVCEVNFRVNKMHKYMKGNSKDDCEFLADLETTRAATCGPSSTNFTICGTLNSLIAQLTLVFSSSVSIEVRVEYCSNWIHSYCKGGPWICPIKLIKGGCELSDITACSAYCHNEGGCDYNDEEHSGSSSGSGSGQNGGSSGSGASSGSSSGGSGSGSSSMEGETGVPCDGTGPCAEETVVPCDGTGPCAEETVVPCDGTGPCAEETVVPCDGTGPCAEETVTPPAEEETVVPCDGTGPCAEETGAPSEEPTASVPAESSPPPSSPPPSSPPPSSPPPSSPPPEQSTSPAAGTTPGSGGCGCDCSKRAELITIDVSCNCTAFLVSITEVVATWNVSMRASIGPTIAQLKAIIYGSMSMEDKIAAIVTQIEGITSVSLKLTFKQITIYSLGADKKTDKTKPWGKVGDFSTCSSSG